MLSLTPSMCAGVVGSMLTTLALAADWYIWGFRYRIFAEPELTSPAGDRDVIQVPSALGRKLLVNRAPQSLDSNIPPAHQVEGEWLDLCGQG